MTPRRTPSKGAAEALEVANLGHEAIVFFGVEANQFVLESCASQFGAQLIAPTGDDLVRLGSALEVLPNGSKFSVELLLFSIRFGGKETAVYLSKTIRLRFPVRKWGRSQVFLRAWRCAASFGGGSATSERSYSTRELNRQNRRPLIRTGCGN